MKQSIHEDLEWAAKRATDEAAQYDFLSGPEQDFSIEAGDFSALALRLEALRDAMPSAAMLGDLLHSGELTTHMQAQLGELWKAIKTS